jgi:D-serine deaminase-like pyridoxal phosphate-dependent protein
VAPGTAIDALDTPVVVVDLTRLERKIRQMAELAKMPILVGGGGC